MIWMWNYFWGSFLESAESLFPQKVKSVQVVSERRWIPSGQKEIQVWENFYQFKMVLRFSPWFCMDRKLDLRAQLSAVSCGPSAVCSPHCNSMPMNQTCQVSEGWAVLCFCVWIRKTLKQSGPAQSARGFWEWELNFSPHSALQRVSLVWSSLG